MRKPSTKKQRIAQIYWEALGQTLRAEALINRIQIIDGLEHDAELNRVKDWLFARLLSTLEAGVEYRGIKLKYKYSKRFTGK